MVIAPLPVVASHFPVALTVLLKVTFRPAPPQNFKPFTEDPFTVSVPVPKVMSPVVALISPKGFGGVPLFADPATEPKFDNKPADGPKLKVGVIGLGPRGREILDQLAKFPQAEVAAICDNYLAMLRRGAAKAPGAAQVEDYKAVLANKDVAAVVVATPSHLHREITIAALAAGKHVYCEAPLATTVEDAKAIALAAKDVEIGRAHV